MGRMVNELSIVLNVAVWPTSLGAGMRGSSVAATVKREGSLLQSSKLTIINR